MKQSNEQRGGAADGFAVLDRITIGLGAAALALLAAAVVVARCGCVTGAL